MKVSELKTNLDAIKLSRNSLKAVLAVRLKEFVATGMGSVENFDPNIISNMTGDNFEPMAHWELLAPEEDDVVQD